MNIKENKGEKVITFAALRPGDVFTFLKLDKPYDLAEYRYMKLVGCHDAVQLDNGVLVFFNPDHKVVKFDATLVIQR